MGALLEGCHGIQSPPINGIRTNLISRVTSVRLDTVGGFTSRVRSLGFSSYLSSRNLRVEAKIVDE